MDKTLKFTVAQLNPVVGDVSGNLKLAEDALAKAREDGSTSSERRQRQSARRS